MADLGALIAKLQAAAEWDQGLDHDIALAVGWTYTVSQSLASARWQDPAGAHHYTPLLFTGSLDAALTLIPESLRHWWSIEWDDEPGGRAAKVFITPDNEAHGETPALALCAAALRARQHLAEQEVSA